MRHRPAHRAAGTTSCPRPWTWPAAVAAAPLAALRAIKGTMLAARADAVAAARAREEAAFARVLGLA